MDSLGLISFVFPDVSIFQSKSDCICTCLCRTEGAGCSASFIIEVNPFWRLSLAIIGKRTFLRRDRCVFWGRRTFSPGSITKEHLCIIPNIRRGNKPTPSRGSFCCTFEHHTRYAQRVGRANSRLGSASFQVNQCKSSAYCFFRYLHCIDSHLTCSCLTVRSNACFHSPVKSCAVEYQLRYSAGCDIVIFNNYFIWIISTSVLRPSCHRNGYVNSLHTGDALHAYLFCAVYLKPIIVFLIPNTHETVRKGNIERIYPAYSRELFISLDNPYAADRFHQLAWTIARTQMPGLFIVNKILLARIKITVLGPDYCHFQSVYRWLTI